MGLCGRIINISTNSVKDTLITVVIPTYNHASLIGEAISSVIKQSYKNIEIIVIDNYSKDKTEEVVNSFADERVIYKKFNNNGVIGASRNVGIKMAKGKLVAFLDSDDFWFEDKLSKAKQVFDENPDIDVVCHDLYLIDESNREVVKKARCGPYKNYEDILFKGSPLFTSATVVKKDKLLEVGLFSEKQEYITVEDYHLWLTLSKSSKIYYLHELLGNFRIHKKSNSRMSEMVDKHTSNFLNVINDHYAKWPKKNIYYNYMINRRKAAISRRAGRILQNDSEFSASMQYIKRALKYDPISIKNWILFIAYTFKIKI